ncbi:GntR family transcriptional regulator [Brevibacterium daeguense]|uniref:GntR family transcriptional regulator n=1 Tax=Brevibacterium daeguense TaxID=909936 RepID=A0ABP8EID3_9MICO|nr:GntR family transcriptional regulator [Brevibacterium daeguense]
MPDESIPLGEHLTLREKATQFIKGELLKGEVRAGTILSANSLARDLGISNSPMREALMDLVAQGLLEVVRNRGFRVRTMTRHDLDEVREMRAILEVAAIQKLAERGLSASERRRAEQLYARSKSIAEFDDRFAILDADHEFHMFLVSLLGNRRLAECISNLRDQTRICGAFDSTPIDDLKACAEEHGAMLESVVLKDHVRAVALMTQHLEYSELSAK